MTKSEVVKELEDIIQYQVSNKYIHILSAAITYLQQEPIGREELRARLNLLWIAGNNSPRGSEGIEFKQRDVDKAIRELSLLPQQEMMSEEEIVRIILDTCEKELDATIGFMLNEREARIFAKALSHIPAGKEEKCEHLDINGENGKCLRCGESLWCKHNQNIAGKYQRCLICKPLPEKAQNVVKGFRGKELDMAIGIGLVEKMNKWIDDKGTPLPEKTYCECKMSMLDRKKEGYCVCGKLMRTKQEEIKQPEKTCLNCGNTCGEQLRQHICQAGCGDWQPKIPKRNCFNCGNSGICDIPADNCEHWKLRPQEESKKIEPLGELSSIINAKDIEKIRNKINEIINHLTQERKI